MSGTLTIPKGNVAHRHGRADYSDLIDVLGSDAFGPRMASYLARLCGADHFAAYSLTSTAIEELSSGSVDPSCSVNDRVNRYVESWWRRDHAMSLAQQSISTGVTNMVRIDFGDRCYDALRWAVFPDVRDRLLVCGRRQDSAVGLSVISSGASQAFGAGAVEMVREMADVLIATLAKHAWIRVQRGNAALALISLDEIERCIVTVSELPRREVEVCARVLYGMSTAGISLDLGIGEESVKTYRKRAYQRLQLGSERELLTWYLALWSDWRGRASGLRTAI